MYQPQICNLGVSRSTLSLSLFAFDKLGKKGLTFLSLKCDELFLEDQEVDVYLALMCLLGKFLCLSRSSFLQLKTKIEIA